jgi:hypothetical protein
MVGNTRETHLCLDPGGTCSIPKCLQRTCRKCVSKFTAGYEALATRYKQDGENLERLLTRCGHDHAQVARKIENKKKRKEPPSATTSASAEVEEDEENVDDESTLAMEDGSSSQDGDNETTNPAPTHRVRRRDSTAARDSLSPFISGSARREDPPASSETMEKNALKRWRNVSTNLRRPSRRPLRI